jgi:cyclase
MLKTRIIPALQLIDESLVKAIQFNKFGYIGDPCNTVRIFNELEVDELCFLDIRASVDKRVPNLKILKDIANECFMPLSYGGGISTFDQAKEILLIGFEKIIINTQAYHNPQLVTDISTHFGAQATVVSIDVRKSAGGHHIYIADGRQRIPDDLVSYAKKMESIGAGELLITSMDREGTWEGFDVEMIRKITNAVNIPVIAHGGGGNIDHIGDVVKRGGASAVALGSMLVYQKKGMGVLVNFPDKKKLEQILN